MAGNGQEGLDDDDKVSGENGDILFLVNWSEWGKLVDRIVLYLGFLFVVDSTMMWEQSL